MEGTYEVCYGDAVCGKVQLLRQGLYFRVICRCRYPGNQVLRLYALRDRNREMIGVVIPEGDGYVLDKKIPAKRLGSGTVRFLLSSGMGVPQGTFVPICPEEPFAYIERLKDAFLASEQGRVGIRIPLNPEAW